MIRLLQKAAEEKWRIAWQYPGFRKRMITGLILLAATLSTFPFFFQTIEKRHGFPLNDWLLSEVPAYNMSVPIFIILWAATLWMVIRAFQQPQVFVLFLWAYILVSVSRLLMIIMVNLDPPVSLIQLTDPISNTFYGMKPVTRDLFYSGHTSSLFLMFLCLQGKVEKWVMLGATLLLVILLLIQHIHYTVDVLAAPLFTFLIYTFVRKKGFGNLQNKKAAK